jgi:hypothetical protein
MRNSPPPVSKALAAGAVLPTPPPAARSQRPPNDLSPTGSDCGAGVASGHGLRQRAAARGRPGGARGRIPLLVAALLLLPQVGPAQIPAAGQEGTAGAARPAGTPLLTVTRMATAPNVDGSVNEAEWASASGTTGFFELGTGRQAERQTEIRLGFDEENLYIAFISRQKALLLREGGKGYNIPFGNDMEGVEVWLQPPGKGFLQWLGVPAGGSLGNCEDHAQDGWSKTVRFASRVEDSGEMMGGTLTLGKKTWSGEIAIPFAALGVAAPADGERWRLNVCRDFSVPPGQARLPADWTTWAPLTGGFAEVKSFGYAQFSRSAPPFRLQSFGDLDNGSVDVEGFSGGRVDLQINATADAVPEPRALERNAKLTEAGRFQVKDSIKMAAAGVTGMRLLVAALDPARGTVLAHAEIPFTLRPTFWIQPRVFYSAQRLEVDLDASRAADLPAAGYAEVGIWNAAGPQALVAARAALDASRPKFQMKLDLSGLAPGNYALKGFLKTAQGDVVATTVGTLAIPEKPAWLGNDLGLSDAVPPPFTAVKVEGKRVAVVQREYLLQDSGLPAQIVSLGENLLAAPATLVTVVNGQPERWAFTPLAPVAQKPREAAWRLAGSSASLELRGTLTIEFDGLGVWDITLAPKGTVVIDNLFLEFPVNRKDALFAKGDGSVVASLLQDRYTQVAGREDIVTLGNRVTEWGFWSYSRSVWAWPEKFCNEIYVGSDRHGFSLMTETDENIFGRKYAEFSAADGAAVVTLRLHLISAQTEIQKPLAYKYLYQTTPLKPEPKDPKTWHVGFDPSSVTTSQVPGYASAEGRRFLSALYVGQAYYDLKPDGYPRWVHSPEESVAGLKYFQGLGMKIVHNLWYAAIAAELPEYQRFGAEWDALPKYGWPSPQANLTSACLGSSYQDFFIWCTEKIVNDLGFDGVYTDATAVPCRNEHHGCGYVGRDGTRHTTLNLLATRNFAKRMYTILKSNGRERLNFSHSGESTSAGAFVDIRTHGEELIQEEKDQYRRLTPDYFRAKYAQNEYGVPYTFYAVYHYKWRAVGEPVPLNEILMMCLVHRVTFGLAYNLEMLPVWHVFDDWWTAATFIPYWRDDCPSTSDDPLNVLASTFVKAREKKALVVVSNWSYKAVRTEVRLDWAKLGFGPAPLKLVDIPSGSATPVVGERATLEIPARDYRVLSIE